MVRTSQGTAVPQAAGARGTELMKMNSERQGQWPERKDSGSVNVHAEKSNAAMETRPDKGGDSAEPRLCFICKKSGYIIKDCPKNPHIGQGQETWYGEGPPNKQASKQAAKKDDAARWQECELTWTNCVQR